LPGVRAPQRGYAALGAPNLRAALLPVALGGSNPLISVVNKQNGQGFPWPV